jgi:hypothetical protein
MTCLDSTNSIARNETCNGISAHASKSAHCALDFIVIADAYAG